MRQGFRVIDSDTHVNPSLDVLLRYADKELQQRIDDLQPYRRTVKTVPGRGDAEDVGSATILSVKPVRLQRVAGEKPSRPPARTAIADFSRGARRWSRASRSPRAWPKTTGAAACATWISRAATSTSSSPGRGPMALRRWRRTSRRGSIAPTTATWPTTARRTRAVSRAWSWRSASDPSWSAQTIKEHAREDWVAAVWPLLPEGMPIDDPDLEPIWAAADEADLPIMYHALYDRDAVLPGLSRRLGQPRDGALRGPDLGRPAVSVVHADGRHARSLSAPADRRPRERPRLAAALARAAVAADRLRARLRLSGAQAHAARIRADGACLL